MAENEQESNIQHLQNNYNTRNLPSIQIYKSKARGIDNAYYETVGKTTGVG